MSEVRQIGVFEAKNRLTALVSEIEAGGSDVIITRRGRPVARLSRVDTTEDRDRARRAAAELKLLSAGLTLGPGLSVRDLIDEGRS